jgi:hypothetical protein
MMIVVMLVEVVWVVGGFEDLVVIGIELQVEGEHRVAHSHFHYH